LEPLPQSRIDFVHYLPNIDNNTLEIQLHGVNIEDQDQLIIELKDDNQIITTYSGPFQNQIILNIPDLKLWSPDSPFLYDLSFTLQRNDSNLDNIESYCGMRKISLGKDEEGILRICLNNTPLFQYGPLDQGYWPESLYTPPTEDALKSDIEMMKNLGFNMIRKHIKVEPLRWYYNCDKLGMLVWQDMPSGGSQLAGAMSDFILRQKHNFTFGRQNKSGRDQFFAELHAMVDLLFNTPSIVIWIPFNEAWGQFQTEKTVNLLKEWDSTRLINNASGWTDAKVGDIHDIHVYPGPAIPPLEPNRAAVCGEFGGLGYEVPDHLWKIKFKWGYRKYSDADLLQQSYDQLMQKLTAFISQGLSAAVYTQITDVEGEINGLLTYDREVLKMPMDWLAEKHNSLYQIIQKSKLEEQ
jgi:beta-galactosidase/beta-glucuronidase